MAQAFILILPFMVYAAVMFGIVFPVCRVKLVRSKQ